MNPALRLWRGVRGSLILWELSAIAFAILLSYYLARHGHLDWENHALGRDFINFWTAGHLVLSGRIPDIFKPDPFLGWEHRLFDPRLPFHFWSYPPPALFLVAPLGLTPYFVGLTLWVLAGFAALIPAARAFFRDERDRWLLVFAPAVAVNIGLGQNGAFTAALLLGGLTLLDAAPVWAGVLFGLLIFKPQIGLMLPVAVIASRNWRALAAAAITGLAVLALSAAVFGIEAWRGFLFDTLPVQRLMLVQGVGPFLWMMPSPYIAARILHLSSNWAMLVEAPFAVLAVVLVWLAYRSQADFRTKAAVLACCTFIASPQGFNYDLIPVAAATILLRREDPSVWGRVLTILLWTLPVIMMPLQSLHAPLTPLILTAAALRLTALCGVRLPFKGRARPPAGPQARTRPGTHSPAG